MTPRSVPQRLAAWLMVGLLALIVGEPLRAHVCPMHDGSVMMLLAGGAGGMAHGPGHQGTPGAATDASKDAATHGEHGDHGSGHDASGAGGSPDGAPADQAPGPHSCQCLGACCVTAPVAAPAPVAARWVETALVATAVVAPTVPVAVPGSDDVVLPFAIGPPPAA